MNINSIYSATFPVTCCEMYFLFVVQTKEETLHLNMQMHFKLSLETNFTERKSWKALDLSILYRLPLEQIIFPV